MSDDELLLDCQRHHSEFQAKYFIIQSAGGRTTYGRYRQALRELSARLDSLQELKWSIWKVKLVVKLAYILFMPTLLIECLRRRLDRLVSTVRELDREADYFRSEAFKTRAKLSIAGEQFPLSATALDRLDREMWAVAIGREVYYDLMTTGKIERNTLDSLLVLPPKLHEQATAEMNRLLDETSSSGYINWLQTKAVLCHQGSHQGSHHASAYPSDYFGAFLNEGAK
jgi:hypothetical protein